MYGLALSGGGARGAYEIGACRALDELGIEIGAICGTSIGSINGAIIAQGDIDIAETIWRSISINDVVEMNGLVGEKLLSFKNIGVLVEQIKKNKGVSMQPLEELLRQTIDEDRLLNSSVDFGLVTYSLTDFTQQELFKRDIPRGKIVDYLMASACMPGIKTKVIANKAFVDGCVSDNMPIGMLANRGFRDIIAIDVGGYGIVKAVKGSGLNIIEVRCESPESGVMEFDSERIARSITGGYLDTKRAMGHLLGKKYALRSADYMRTRRRLSQDLIDGLEIAADIFGIDKLREYTVTSLSRRVCKNYNKILKENKDITLETLLGGKQNSRALLLAKVCELYIAGNADILNSKIVGNMLRDFTRAVNAIAYFI